MVSINNQQLKTNLHIFLGIVATLIIIGMLFVYSSSSIYALEKFGYSHYFVKRQCIGLIVGLCGLICARFFPLQLIKKMSPFLFLGSLFLTALTLMPTFAQHIHGSSRWISIRGFSFQPSELLKIALLIYLAYFLTKKEQYISSLQYCYFPFLIILGLTSSILLLQPDFGLTVTLLITAFILLFIAQFPVKYLIWTFSGLLPIGIMLIYFRPYRLQRILTFLNPWADPQGSGFQIIQSLIAIGSGSLWGLGISHSKQKFFYLPMQHTDFIFSIIAEETGFVGACFLIMLYLFFLYFGIRIARQLNDKFSTFVILGFVTLISLQAVINLAVATGLAPTKGIGLPFVSYGNTALVCNLTMIGLIINIVYEYSPRFK